MAGIMNLLKADLDVEECRAAAGKHIAVSNGISLAFRPSGTHLAEPIFSLVMMIHWHCIPTECDSYAQRGEGTACLSLSLQGRQSTTVPGQIELVVSENVQTREEEREV